MSGDGWGAPCEANPTTPVTIAHAHGTRDVMGFVFGAWAVHRAVPVDGCTSPDPDTWAVSHIPTGTSIGLVLEISFWDAIRVARALEDTGVFPDDSLDCEDGSMIFQSAIGAAMSDHYVWPLVIP